MARQDTEMLKGVLEGVVLAVLARQPAYGYEITADLRARGFTDLAEGTVKIHVSAVLRALGARNRTQAVIAANQLGLRLVTE